jgi:hypothetical protein
MKKFFFALLIITLITLLQCDEGKETNVSDTGESAQKETTGFELTNIANVELTNLTDIDPTLNRGLFSLNDKGKGYFIDREWNIYKYDLEQRKAGVKLSNISVMNYILRAGEKVLSFTYYGDKMLVDIKTKEKNRDKVNSYLIDAEKNTRITFTIPENDHLYEFIGTYSDGDKALILAYPESETYSAVYTANTKTGKVKSIIENITLLGYSFSEDREYFVFYGNTEKRLPRDTYDYTSLGNFFLYYPDDEERNPATFLYILNLKTNEVKDVPNSSTYYYSWLKGDILRVEDYEGEFFKVDPTTGEKLEEIEYAVYRILDYYREGHRNKETERYVLLEVNFDYPKKERLLYIDKRSGDEVAMLDVNHEIVHVNAVNEDYALFSVLRESTIVGDDKINSGDEIVYLMEF